MHSNQLIVNICSTGSSRKSLQLKAESAKRSHEKMYIAVQHDAWDKRYSEPKMQAVFESFLSEEIDAAEKSRNEMEIHRSETEKQPRSKSGRKAAEKKPRSKSGRKAAEKNPRTKSTHSLKQRVGPIAVVHYDDPKANDPEANSPKADDPEAFDPEAFDPEAKYKVAKVWLLDEKMITKLLRRESEAYGASESKVDE